jgi:hypothetical protein
MLGIIIEVPTIDPTTKSMLVDLINKSREDTHNTSIIKEPESYETEIEKSEAI